MKNENPKFKEGKKWLAFLIIGGFLTHFLAKIWKNKKSDWRELVKDEVLELNELVTGRENGQVFCRHSFCTLKDFFVPHPGNGHRPHLFHPYSLATIAFSLLSLKIFILAFVFLSNPFQAWMSGSMQAQVFELINNERRAANLPELAINPVLEKSALDKANDMVKQGYFAHFSPDGKKPWDFINRQEYAYLYVGENLAMNFTSANSVHKALMDSPSHKKNIMNEQYSEVGLAVISGELEGKQTNILVQLYGTRKAVGSSVAAAKTVEAKTESAAIKPTTTDGGITVASESKPPEKIEASKPAAIVPKAEVDKPSPNAPKVEAAKPVLPVRTPEPEKSEDEKALAALPPLPAIAVNSLLAMAESDLDLEASKTAGVEAPIMEEVAADYTSVSAGTSPNSRLETMGQAEIIRMPNQDNPKFVFFASLIKYANNIFALVLVLMIAFLAVNILVRIKVQHRHVIIQAIVLLIFIAGLAYWQVDVLAAQVTDIFLL